MSNFERTVIVGGRNFEKLRLRVAYAQANGMELALPYTVMDRDYDQKPACSLGSATYLIECQCGA